MKILLRVLAGIFVLGVAVVVAGVAIVLSIDPNEYRDRVTAEVKAATGRDLIIKGDLSIGISLIPTIVANDVAFSNAVWGSRPQMATIKRLEAALEIVPALSGEIRIGRIVLVEPDILLEVASDGRANWDFTQPSATTDSAPAQAPVPAQQAAGGPPTLPTVEAVSIDKARLRFNDMKAKTDMALVLDRVRIDRASGGLGVDVAGAYNDVSFAVKGKTDLLDGLAADDKFGFDLEATALAAALKIKGAVTKPLSVPRLAVDFALSGKDLVATLESARALAPQLAGMTVPPLGSYNIAGRATGPAAAPSVDNLKFNIGSTDMLKLAGSGKASKTAVSLDSLSAQVYGSDVQGSVIAETGGKVPDIKANLTSRLIDVADFEKLAAAFEGKAETSTTPTAKGSSAPSSAAGGSRGDDGRVFPNDPLPLEGLKAANATVSFKGAKIVAKGTNVEAIDVIAKLNGGRLLLDPMAAMIAGGRLAGKATLDASAATPALDADLSVDKLDLGGLLKERGVTDVLTGKISTKIDARGRGNSIRAMMAGLNGETEIVMDEGVIASRYVDLLAADLTKQLIPGGSGNAKINCFVSRFDVKQGIATSKALLFDTEKMTVAGGGTINLRDETLDMGIEPQPKEKSLVSLAVPLKIGGTLASPSVAPSTTSLLKGIAGLAVTGLTPAGILLNLANTGTGDENPCVAALNRAPAKGTAPTQGQGTQGQQAPAQGPSPMPNPLDTLRSLFGGSK